MMNHLNIGVRIMVIGSPGSGKSTFSRYLAGIVGIPLIHLDREYWQAGWIETSKDEWRREHQALLQGEHWILDGNYDRTMDDRLDRADTVICFDLPRRVCLMGYLKRLLTHIGKVRPDMPDGCVEKLDWAFLRYIWKFPQTSGRNNKARLVRMSHKTIIIFSKRSEVKRWLRELQNGINSGLS